MPKSAVNCEPFRHIYPGISRFRIEGERLHDIGHGRGVPASASLFHWRVLSIESEACVYVFIVIRMS